MPAALKGSTVLASVSGTEPPLMAADRIRGGDVCSARRAGHGDLFLDWQECKTNKKALRPKPQGLLFCQQKRSVFGSRLRSRRLRRYFRARRNFGTELAQTREKIAKFAAFAFLGLAVLALAL